jgi:F-type H+-transporting ATPase subunit delta
MPDQEQQLAAALKRKLGREIKITSEKSPDLIGGFRLRAGDMVIDGSVSGQLGKLANELGI